MLEAHKLQAEGRTQKEIAEILGVTDRTVRNYLREAPRKRKPPIRTSKLDPYLEFIVKSEIIFPVLSGLIFPVSGKNIIRSQRPRLSGGPSFDRNPRSSLSYENDEGGDRALPWQPLHHSSVQPTWKRICCWS